MNILLDTKKLLLRFYNYNYDYNNQRIVENILLASMQVIEAACVIAAFVVLMRKGRMEPKQRKVVTIIYFVSRIIALIFAVFCYVLSICAQYFIQDDSQFGEFQLSFDAAFESIFFLLAKTAPSICVIYLCIISIGVLNCADKTQRFLTWMGVSLSGVFCFITMVVSTALGLLNRNMKQPSMVIFPTEAIILLSTIIIITVQLIMLIKKEKQSGHLLYQEQRLQHKKLFYLALMYLEAITITFVVDLIIFIMLFFQLQSFYISVAQEVGQIVFCILFIAAQFPPQAIFANQAYTEEIMALMDEDD